MKSKRQIQKERRRRKSIITTLGMVGAGLAVVALIFYYSLQQASGQAVGQQVAVMPDSSHVPEGTDPGPYNSDPPSSGRHYEVTLEPGFYEAGQVQAEYPAGHLVHNLEHGYVIFWYNCSLLSEEDCSDLKGEIRGVMDQENNFKVIGFPWSSTDVPVVMTSWGRMLSFEQFDTEQALNFVRANRNKAPEPNAP